MEQPVPIVGEKTENEARWTTISYCLIKAWRFNSMIGISSFTIGKK